MEDQSAVALIVLPAALAVIMVSLGLSLTPEDFRRVFVFPRGVMIGLANLLVISPLLAFGMAELFALPAALAVGLVVLGASPGGTMANMLTHLARGDVALSVTMTAVSSLAAVITVPLFLGLAVNRFGSGIGTDVEIAGVVVRVFLITLIPLGVGMLARARAPAWAERNFGTFRKAALGVFFLVVILAIVSEHEKVFEHFTEVVAAAVALNVAAMTVSFVIAKSARLSDPQATAISMELGLHNATLAIAVAATVATELAIPAAVYSSFAFVTGGLFAAVMARRNPAPQPAAA